MIISTSLAGSALRLLVCRYIVYTKTFVLYWDPRLDMVEKIY